MAHSEYSPSASHRWLHCPGSIALIRQLKADGTIPEKDKGSDAADLGTAVHHIIEQVLLGNGKIANFRKAEIKEGGMQKSFTMSAKELSSARKCVTYVNKIIKGNKDVDVYPERKYDLSHIYGVDIGGTSDVTLAEKNGTLEITDYKNGNWPVEVENNSQLLIYGLGAWYHLNDKYDFQDVKLTVVQPNSNHKDGIIRSDNITVENLREWESETLIPVIDETKKGGGKLVPNEREQCFFCPAKDHCEARKLKKQKLVTDVLGDLVPRTDKGTLPDPKDLTPEEINEVLKNAKLVIKFYNDCSKYAIKEMEENNLSLNSWALDVKLGNRKFIDSKEFNSILKKRKISKDDITIKQDRLMTVTELESYLKNDLKWKTKDVTVFMEEITKRDKTGHALKKVDSVTEEFAEFAKQETKKPRRSRRSRNRRK